MLITFEGGECSGKDLQVDMLAKRLAAEGVNVHFSFYEPGSTLKAEIIRMLLKNKNDSPFEFPGDFNTTFDFSRFAAEFSAEEVPPLAAKYMRAAKAALSEGIKYEVIHFLLSGEFIKNGKLLPAIKSLSKKENAINAVSASPADIFLKEFFTPEKLGPIPQMYLYVASRNFLYHSKLHDALEKYDCIIMNRSVDSCTVYQGHAQNPQFIGKIRELNLESTEGIVPSLSIYIDVSVEEAARRKAIRDSKSRYIGITKDFFDEKNSKFHESIRDGYLKEVGYYASLPKDHPEHKRLIAVDGHGSPLEVHERILAQVLPMIKMKATNR